MRLRTLLMTTSLLLVALSLPPASADPVPDHCQPTTQHIPDGTVQLREDCTVAIGIWMTCAPPSHTTRTFALPGGHELTLSVCDGGADQTVGRLVQTRASEPGCPPKTIETEGPLGTNRFEQEHNCSTTTTLNEGIICLGGSVDRDEYRVLSHTVVVYSCGNPNQGGGLGDPIAASGPQPCQGSTLHAETVLGGVNVAIGSDCTPTVTGPGADALRPSVEALSPRSAAAGCEPAGTHAETVLGGIYVGVDEDCRPDVRHNGGPLGATAAAAGCEPAGTHAETVLGGIYVGIDGNCRPVVKGSRGATAAEPGCQRWNTHAETVLGGLYVEQEHNCRVHAVSGGSNCDHAVSRDVSGNTVTVCTDFLDPVATVSAAPSCEKVPSPGGGVTVHDDCRIYIQLVNCPWGGYYQQVAGVSSVRVYTYRCGSPPTTASSMADPLPTCVREPCGPGVPVDACSRLSAVGVEDGLNTLDVRDDCTVEAGVFDHMMCVGGWGSQVERQVAGSTVRVSVCDGGIGHRLGDLEFIQPAAGVRDPFPTCVTEPCGPSVPGPVAPCSKYAGTGYLPGATYTIDSGCNVVVDVKFYDCVWNGHWRTVRAGPVTLRVYECSGPGSSGTSSAASLADPFPTCVTEPCGPQVPHPCNTLQAVGYDDGLNTLRFRNDCTFELGVMDGAICVGGWGHTSERDVAGNTVRVTVCDGGLGHRLGDLVQTTGPATAFRCAYLYEDVHGPLGNSSVEGEYTCWFNVVVGEGVHCTGGDAERTERQILNVNVVTYTCDGPDAGTTASAGGPCDRIERTVVSSEELTWTIDSRCRHDVYVDVIECPNEAQWTKTNEQMDIYVGTLHYTFCRLG